MPRKVFTAGEVLAAADVNSFLMDQTVMVFAGTAARGSAIGTATEGMYAHLNDTDTLTYYNGSAWANAVTSPGLTLVKSQAIGTTVASVVVNDAFNADYDAYKIVVIGGVLSTDTALNMQLGASTTNYFYAYLHATYDNTPKSAGAASQSSWNFVGGGDTNQIHASLDLINPFLAKPTTLANATSNYPSLYAGSTNGYHSTATSYTSFTLTPNSGTMTGGTVNVYGYRKA
jgi:hypothetical protein